MKIGVPKEIKIDENRVGIIPAGVKAFTKAGHKVLIQTGAGFGSSITDDDYLCAGAEIVATAEEVYSKADMVYKVKEPLPPEYELLREGQILFTYLHLAAEPVLTKVLMSRGVVAIAFETVQTADGFLPLLAPMSEVAGRMAVQVGAHILEKNHGGSGVLLGGVPGVAPAQVVIAGGGIVGTNAAKIALGLGAKVTILDVNINRLRYLDDIFGNRITTLASNEYNLAWTVSQADLLIGAVLLPGRKAPRLVSEDMVKKMKPGAAIVDVAIDQGGCIETIDRTTNHQSPTYEKYGVIHYAVPNIPGIVPTTSTFALANVTLPFALELASRECSKIWAEKGPLARGFNVLYGQIVHEGVAAALDLQ